MLREALYAVLVKEAVGPTPPAPKLPTAPAGPTNPAPVKSIAPVAPPKPASIPTPSAVGQPAAAKALDSYVGQRPNTPTGKPATPTSDLLGSDAVERQLREYQSSVAPKTPQQDWATNLAAQAKPIGSDPNSATAKALAYKPKRDWANTTYAGGAPTDPAARVMSNDGQWAASKGNQTAPVAPHPTVAQNSAILDKNKNVSAEIDKQVSDSRTKRINTTAEHAKGFADLKARLDRAGQAVGAAQGGNRSAARTIMERPIQSSFDPTWGNQPQRRTYDQLYKMYNDLGAGSGMWTPAAYEAMVDEAGSTTQQGRQNFLTAGKLQDFDRKHGR